MQRNKEALIRSSALVDAVFTQSADDLIYGHAGRLDFVRANNNALSMFGIEKVSQLHELITRSFF